MRVVHLCPLYTPATGGVERFVSRLSEAQAARGDQVEVWTTTAATVSALTAAGGEHFAAGETRIGGIRVRRFPVRYLPAQRYLLTAAHALPFGVGWKSRTLRWSPLVPALAAAAASHPDPVDIVHACPLPYSSVLEPALQLATRTGARLALTPFTHLGKPGPEADRVRRRYLSPLNLALLGAADRLFVQTRAEWDALAAAGLPDSRICLGGVGADPAECTGGDRARGRARWHLGATEIVVGHLANKSWDKGTVDLLDAAEALWARGAAFRLVLAGQEMPSFTRRWARTTFRDRIVNLGRLDDQEKRDFYASIDLFALPSYVESFGISPLEAALNGIPTVGYALGGLRELWDAGHDAVLVEPGNIHELQGRLLFLVSSESERRRLGRAAAEMAAGHTWAKAMTRVLVAYDELARLRPGDVTAAAEVP
jgi:glycosyltransferase involved in cell wall biosynthesis